MKLWIDDLRTPPNGYIWVKSVNKAKEIIKEYSNKLDFDNNMVDEIELIEQQELEKEEFNKKLHEAIDKLTDKQRKVIYMYFWENKTFRQIGKELGVHFTTIEESYNAAIKKIKKILKNF